MIKKITVLVIDGKAKKNVEFGEFMKTQKLSNDNCAALTVQGDETDCSEFIGTNLEGLKKAGFQPDTIQSVSDRDSGEVFGVTITKSKPMSPDQLDMYSKLI